MMEKISVVLPFFSGFLKSDECTGKDVKKKNKNGKKNFKKFPVDKLTFQRKSAITRSTHKINHILQEKERITMKQKKIRLTTINDAMEFVKRASRCDFDIDVFYNRVVIDAKSLLGVLSLDLTRVLTVSMNGRDAEFESYLDELKIAA